MAEILYESNYYGVSSLGDSLEHHGIKGQKWGIRRFQNPDGSLTAAGKQRYGTVENFKRSREGKSQRKEKVKKALKTGAKVAAGAAAAYAVYRLASRPSSMARTLNSIRKMSDEELLERLGRLEREKKVFDITREQQSLYESNTKRILKAAGKGAATTIASAGALYGAKQGIKYAAKASGKDGDKLLREMFPKKK